MFCLDLFCWTPQKLPAQVIPLGPHIFWTWPKQPRPNSHFNPFHCYRPKSHISWPFLARASDRPRAEKSQVKTLGKILDFCASRNHGRLPADGGLRRQLLVTSSASRFVWNQKDERRERKCGRFWVFLRVSRRGKKKKKNLAFIRWSASRAGSDPFVALFLFWFSRF